MRNKKYWNLWPGRYFILTLLVMFLSVVAQATLVGLKQNSDSTVDLVVIDPDTGITETLKTNTGLVQVNAMTFDPVNNKLFASSIGYNSSPVGVTNYPILYRIDWGTWNITQIGPICSTDTHRCEGLAYNVADGRLYATVTDDTHTSSDELVTVNPTNGECTPFGIISGTAQGNDGDTIVFAEGTLFASDSYPWEGTVYTEIYRIDTDSSKGSVEDIVLKVIAAGISSAYEQQDGLIYYTGHRYDLLNAPQYIYSFDPFSPSPYATQRAYLAATYAEGIRGLVAIKPLYSNLEKKKSSPWILQLLLND